MIPMIMSMTMMAMAAMMPEDSPPPPPSDVSDGSVNAKYIKT